MAVMNSIKANIKTADLFCGAGGLSLGLKTLGIKSVFSADSWKAAVNTYNHNVEEVAQQISIDADISLPKVDVIVGGPPCQGFSSAGLRKEGDSRNTLVGVYANLIARHRPKAFVFENVEGFLTSEGGDYVIDLLKPLIEAGYFIKLRKINAANYGVPQHRKRVLAIGLLGAEPTFPCPTTLALGAPGAENLKGDLPYSPSVLESLSGLPEPSCSREGENLQGHFSPILKDDDFARVSALKQGQTMKDLPQELWHDTFKKRAFRRVQDGMPSEKRGGAPAGIRRLIGDHPSKTITGGARSEFVHPVENRYLTLRECARLQTFPDEFIFMGTQSEQAQMIGNAVPPSLGVAIGKALIESLPRANASFQGKGRLVEFVPTLSSGMSPALKTLCDKVNQLYFEEMRELDQL